VNGWSNLVTRWSVLLMTDASSELAAATSKQQEWTYHWLQGSLQAARRKNGK